MKNLQIATPDGEFGCEIQMVISTDKQHNIADYQKQLLKSLRAGNQPMHIIDNNEVVGLVRYIV